MFTQSHPAWVCGLKLNTNLTADNSQVTPCVGVWIETMLNAEQNAALTPSHPAWVCGLKLKNIEYSKDKARHTLRGCVD